MKKNILGMTLIEILVVLSLFTVIVVVANQALFATIRGATKSKTTTRVKQDGDYVVSVMERSIHSASSYVGCSSQTVAYSNPDGTQSNFTCTPGTPGQGGVRNKGDITKDGESLIGPNTDVDSCTFTCSLTGGQHEVQVDMTLIQYPTGTRPEENASVDVRTKIRFRN